MTTIRFKKGNKLFYEQEYRIYQGIPADVTFDVEFIDKEREQALLTAPRYGGDPYGDGNIFITKNSIMLVEPIKKERKSKKKLKGEK